MAVGDLAADFTGHDFINDGTFTLSDHVGDVVLLGFMAKG